MSGPFYMPGTYRGVVKSTALTKAKKTDTNQFAVTFEVLGKVDPSDPENLEAVNAQYDRTAYKAITDKTWDWLLRDLEALGLDHLESFAQLQPGGHDFTGVEANFVCEHSTYDGKVSEKWNIASGAGSVAPLEDKEVRKLDALFGSKLKKNGSKPTAKPNGKPNGKPTAKKTEVEEAVDEII